MEINLPNIISVDDHVVEPPDLWTSRVPRKHKENAPRLERHRMSLDVLAGGVMKWRDASDGTNWADVWTFEDVRMPLTNTYAAAGIRGLEVQAVTLDDYPRASWIQADRLKAMDLNGVDASVCFPNTIPRFCGQTFLEGKDKELGLECVRAYNDWITDEWCAGAGTGRLIPVTIIPLWSPELAAAEIRRCAGKGSFAITFPENPVPLGLPSVHDTNRFWDPVFATCAELDVVVCMHIGSSSKLPTTSPDAPWIITSLLMFENSVGSLCDFLFSGVLDRFPGLKLAYAEGQAGWMPYVLERADKFWHERANNAFGSSLANPPSTYMAGRIYSCIFDDLTGLYNRESIGMSQLCFEVDYPHVDSTFPHSKTVLRDLALQAGLNDSEVYQFARGNAVQAFGLGRFGWDS